MEKTGKSICKLLILLRFSIPSSPPRFCFKKSKEVRKTRCSPLRQRVFCLQKSGKLFDGRLLHGVWPGALKQITSGILRVFAYDRRKMPLTGAECKTARFPEGKPVQARLGFAAKMVRPAGIEPATLGFGGQNVECS